MNTLVEEVASQDTPSEETTSHDARPKKRTASEMLSTWSDSAQLVIRKHPWVFVSIVGVAAFILAAYILGWKWTGFPQKNLFNWLQILVIPVAVAIGTFFLNQQAKVRDDEAQKVQRQRDQEAQQERAEEDALQAYLDQLTSLLLIKLPRPHNKSGSLVRANLGDGTLQVIQARTEVLLRQLRDPLRLFTLIVFLSEAHLIYTDKPLVTFRGANLKRVKGRYAHLSNVDLTGVDFEEAVLRHANLGSATLVEANLRGVDLTGATLIRADLTRANLREANLREANLSAVVTGSVNWNNQYEGANLTGADLTGANLTKANLTDANLTSANLSGAKVTDAILSPEGANLRGVTFPAAKLRGVDLKTADLQGAELAGADLTGAKLGSANLSEADLQGTTLTRADLKGAHLQGAKCQGANLNGASLQGAQFRGANLIGADLSRANLQGADLQRADLRGADITLVNLISADLREVTNLEDGTLDWVVGDALTTNLPAGIHTPAAWSMSIREQEESIKDRLEKKARHERIENLKKAVAEANEF